MFIPGTGNIKPTASPGNIPPGAILLSPNVVRLHHVSKIKAYKPQLDVCMLRYGNVTLGVCAAVGGAVINAFFRNRFKLRQYGVFFTYIPIMVMPFIGAFWINDAFIRNNIILGYYPCAICGEMRSGLYQSFIGALYPTTIAPVMCATFARQHMTYPIPSLKDPNAFVRLTKTVTPGFSATFFAVVAAQFVMGGLVAGVQLKQFYANMMSRREDTGEGFSEVNTSEGFSAVNTSELTKES